MTDDGIYRPLEAPEALADMYDADRSGFDDPRTSPFRSGVECFACRRPCRNPSTSVAVQAFAGPTLWAHRDCLAGKPFLVLYYAAVNDVARGVGK